MQREKARTQLSTTYTTTDSVYNYKYNMYNLQITWHLKLQLLMYIIFNIIIGFIHIMSKSKQNIKIIS